MGEYYHFSFAAWHGFGKFAFYSALDTWRVCFFKRSCMVIVLIKAFVYNCTIMPPKSSGIQTTTRPKQFSTCYCWAEVQKTNSPSRLPLLSHATIEKNFWALVWPSQPTVIYYDGMGNLDSYLTTIVQTFDLNFQKIQENGATCFQLFFCESFYMEFAYSLNKTVKAKLDSIIF